MNAKLFLAHRNKLLLLAVAVVVTSVLQVWVAAPLLYRPNAAKALTVHNAILAQQPPDGKTWSAIGANGLAQRLPTVWLAEGVHRVTGLSLGTVYLLQDSAFLLAELLLLMVWLRRFLPPAWAAVGWLWFVAIAPTTYLFYYFHPWDRPSQCLWLIVLIGLVDRRHWQFFGALALGMWVKVDMLLLPFIYAAVTFGEDDRRKWLLRSGAAFGLSGGVFLALGLMHPHEPNAAEQGRALQQLAAILTDVRKLGFTYPPILMFGLPVTLLALGYKKLALYHRAALVYTLLVLCLYAATSEFRESRTHVPMFLLLLPGAMLVVREWLEGTPEPR
jgi:hypothetical protein